MRFFTSIAAAAALIISVSTAFAQSILTPFQTATVVVGESFDPAKNFRVDNDKVQFSGIYLVGKKFAFIKVEAPRAPIELKVQELKVRSVNKEIGDVLGDKAEITLGQLYQILLKQGNGEEGALRLTGMNVAYVRDDQGVLWSVLVQWWKGMGSRDGWNIQPLPMDSDLFHPVPEPDRPNRGTRVISR